MTGSISLGGCVEGQDYRTESNFAIFLRITHYEQAFTLTSGLVKDVKFITSVTIPSQSCWSVEMIRKSQ